MKRSVVSLAFLFLLLGGSVAPAEEAEPTVRELLERIEAQQAELEALKQEIHERPTRTEIEEAASAAAAAAESEDPDRIRLGLFYLETVDGNFRFDVQGRLLAQYQASDRGHRDFDNGFENRQLRFDLKGILYERITFHIALEFGRGTDDALFQGWVNMKVFEWLQLKAGQDKLPLTFSFLEPFRYMNHAEWAMILGNETAFFDLGAQLWGWLVPKRLKYVLAAFNGSGPNTRGDLDDDDVDLIARLEAIPFDYLNIHVAGDFTPTNRDARGPRSARTLGNQYTFFTTFDPNNRRLKERTIATTGAILRMGPFEFLAELVVSHHRKVRSGTTGNTMDLTLWSYFIGGVWIITGEKKLKTIQRVDDPLYRLSSDEDEAEGDWGLGAWALALRFEDFQVEKSALTRGFATGTDKARAVVATLDWWPWKSLRYSLTYSYTAFDDRVADSAGRLHNDDHIVVFRAWLTF